jgi:transposase
MRKIREILRLALGEGLSRRATGVATGLPYTTVSEHLVRAVKAGLGWPLPDGMDDAQLEARLFAKAEPPPSASRPLPDWPTVHRELRRKGMTLQLLHMEYKERQPDGYQYTQFCRHYRAWQRHLDVVMRQEHRAGEKLFVDFAGQTIPITDPATGEITQAQLFVAVLGASNYTYAEALPSQELPHWIAAHVAAFAFLGGCPRLIVPDNLRSGVTRAHRYEPDINPTYAEMAAHYGAAVIPARPYKPGDKAKAEQGVLLAERWILAALRHRTFFSIAEANEAIRERLAWLNARPFKKLPGSRASLFTELDRPALRPLPAVPYEFAPGRPRGQHRLSREVDATDSVLSARRRGMRHPRHGRDRGSPPPRQAGGEPPSLGRAAALHHGRCAHARGASPPCGVEPFADRRLGRRDRARHGSAGGRDHGVALREQGFRSCLGIMRLGRRYGDERLEAAAARALAIRALSYRSVESILKGGLDGLPLPGSEPVTTIGDHANVRGAGYYE